MSTSPATDGGLERAQRRPGAGRRIVVVDESPYLGGVLVSALEHEGCTARVARTPSQATQLAQSTAPDLFVIDIDGGAIDADVIAALSKSNVPMVVIAPNARDFDAGRGGVARVFGKPFYPSEVVAAVLETLGRPAHP